MGWLEDGIVDFLSSLFDAIANDALSIFELAKMGPAEFNGALWNTVTGFNENVVKPVAFSILGLFLLLELANVMRRSESQGLEGVRLIGIVFLKIAFCKLAVDNATEIVNAVFEISGKLVGDSIGYFSASSIVPDSQALADALEGTSTATLLFMFLEGVIIQIAAQICFLLSRIVVQLRYIEIYVFSSVAALPMATFPSQEHSSIGKNYIKRMSALAIHAVFILVVIFIYVTLVGSEVVIVEKGNVLGSIWSHLGYSILLVIALFQTGGWSKSIMGVN